jgi:hypothetical protein
MPEKWSRGHAGEGMQAALTLFNLGVLLGNHRRFVDALRTFEEARPIAEVRSGPLRYYGVVLVPAHP